MDEAVLVSLDEVSLSFLDDDALVSLDEGALVSLDDDGLVRLGRTDDDVLVRPGRGRFSVPYLAARLPSVTGSVSRSLPRSTCTLVVPPA